MNSSYTLIPYREHDHGTFDEEWLPHKKSSGWWYITGYLSDKNNPEHLYTYQYTVAQGRILGKTVYIQHMSFTDIQSGSHLFNQHVKLRRGKKVRATQDEVVFEPYTELRKEQQHFDLMMNIEDF